MNNKLQIITTWWTIDKDYWSWKWVYDFHIWNPTVSDILTVANIKIEDVEIHSLLKKDSMDMSDEERKKVAEFIANKDAERFLVTHGTDTMVESAEMISQITKAANVIQRLIDRNKKFSDKIIALVWASRPYSMKVTDADFNIWYWLWVINTIASVKGKWVFICMNWETFKSWEVEKWNDGIFRKLKI